MKSEDVVELVLENCEVYGFSRKDVDAYLDGLGKHYFGKDKYNMVEHCAIIIHDDCKKPAKVIVFDEDQDKDWWGRITRNPDITQVHIDGECYFVDWSDYDEWDNTYQTNYEKNGNKVIIISKTRKSLDDF